MYCRKMRRYIEMGISKYRKEIILICILASIIVPIVVIGLEQIQDAITTDASVTITYPEGEFPVVEKGKPVIIKFDFRFPGDWLTQFNAEITVKNTNWDGEVRVSVSCRCKSRRAVFSRNT
ncbi:hypothetical protein M1N11_04850 [Peptococcaceae bacterium]|nr:hypothetical protein [Peptococcaceae bacterium]